MIGIRYISDIINVQRPIFLERKRAGERGGGVDGRTGGRPDKQT